MDPSAASDDSGDGVARVSTAAWMAARVGLARLFSHVVGGTLPPRSQEQIDYDTMRPATVSSVVEEYLRGGGAREAAALRDFGDRPLFVLTAGEGHPASWMTAQRTSATLSTNSVHEVVAGASHQALEDESQYAAHITRAVLAVVASVRSGQPLSAGH